jgi:hypothetical protein
MLPEGGSPRNTVNLLHFSLADDGAVDRSALVSQNIIRKAEATDELGQTLSIRNLVSGEATVSYRSDPIRRDQQVDLVHKPIRKDDANPATLDVLYLDQFLRHVHVAPVYIL